MEDFKELEVWSKSHELTVLVYRLTHNFPREEVYGLTSQLRRSAASIAANIAEGCGRRSDRELARFLQIARGSASETEYHLLLAKDLGFLKECTFRDVQQKVFEIQRMLTGLVQKVQPASMKAQSAKPVVARS